MLKTAHQLVQEAKVHIKEASPADIGNMMVAPDVLIIDVREPDEYRQGHLPGAINVPRGMLEFQISNEAALQNLTRPIIVYCKTSGRAALAALSMQTMGFRNVVSLAGGFVAWAAGNHPVDKPAEVAFD
ncbi:MAG: hypothetical protein H6R10_3470 [Rhodocyclaceae bacterium]|nr:hypothetical protein [Rhodocyclaceae bacterium]